MLPEGIDAGWFWTNVLTALVLPPAGLLLAIVFGLLLLAKQRILSAALFLVTGIGLLWVLSTPWMAYQLQASLVTDAPFSLEDFNAWKEEDRPQAIVVLGGGRNRSAYERPGGEDVSSPTLARIRYAAVLYRATRLPLMTTGGKPTGGKLAEAVLMAEVLEQEFKVPVLLVESQSLNTTQTAVFSRPLLSAARVDRILLVTDAFHMRRARMEFRNAGLQVIPAPMGFRGLESGDPKNYLPTARGLMLSSEALREWLGIAVFTLRRSISRWS